MYKNSGDTACLANKTPQGRERERTKWSWALESKGGLLRLCPLHEQTHGKGLVIPFFLFLSELQEVRALFSYCSGSYPTKCVLFLQTKNVDRRILCNLKVTFFVVKVVKCSAGSWTLCKADQDCNLCLEFVCLLLCMKLLSRATPLNCGFDTTSTCRHLGWRIADTSGKLRVLVSP